MANELLIAQVNQRHDDATDRGERRIAKRDSLYYGFRYRVGSYKARKAMIHPFLMTAKREDSMLRLYDDGSHQPTKHQEQAMTDKCKGWRIKEKLLAREQKQLAKRTRKVK